MRRRAEFHRFYKIVTEVGVNARLTKRIESRSRTSPTNEPRLEVFCRWVMECTRFPNIITMATDEMRPAIAVDLGVND
jgi:hypothetical protein